MNIATWNDRMYAKHPTPYLGMAGFVEKIRVRKVQQLANLKRSDTVLEIGCEAGNLLLTLPDVNSKTGLDISLKALRKAKAHAKQVKATNVSWIQGDAMKSFSFKRGQFSVIICSETLEHVLDPQKVIENISKICNKNTRVIITVPNEKPKLILKNWLTRAGALHWLMPNIEEGQSEWHLHAFTRELLAYLVKKDFTIFNSSSILGLHEIMVLKLRSEKLKRF